MRVDRTRTEAAKERARTRRKDRRTKSALRFLIMLAGDAPALQAFRP